MNYYNEIDPYCGQWLRNLIQGKYIPDGKVDERSIADVMPGDLDGFTQCHFFAGLAGWPRALELAGWPSDRQVWTGSCPCQPFSVAGKRKGDADERHLWPEFYRLIIARHPDVVMGEQVSGAAGLKWLDGVVADLESEGYSCRAADIPACAVNAPHRRNRLYWVANTSQQPQRESQHEVCAESRQDTWADTGGSDARSERLDNPTEPRHDSGRSSKMAQIRDGSWSGESERRDGDGGWVAHRLGPRLEGRQSEQRDDGEERETVEQGGDECGGLGNSQCIRRPWGQGAAQGGVNDGQDARWLKGDDGFVGTVQTGFWRDFSLIGPDRDGKWRRAKPGVRLLAHGVPSRVAKLRALGNAIVPQCAAEFIQAFLDTEEK